MQRRTCRLVHSTHNICTIGIIILLTTNNLVSYEEFNVINELLKRVFMCA